MPKSIPKVAIITRTKNRPEFLARCIESVLSQTEQDYVHVILNDGGNRDEVESVLAKLPSNKRYVVHNSESVGITPALNQAIKSVDSEYIAILDDDDQWHPDRLKLGLEVIAERGAVASVAPMEIVIEDVNSDGEIVEVERRPHPESWCGEVSLYKQAHRNYLSNGAVMYARSVYEELGGYDESLVVAEDWDFGIRLVLLHNVEQVIVDYALIGYHQRPDVKSGDIGNSVHAGVREQERAIMQVRNNYLRKDLEKGVLGVGYIMNDIEQSLINVERLERHMNYVGSDIKKCIDATSLYRRVRDKLRRNGR